MPQGYDDDYDGVPNTADDLAIRQAMKGGRGRERLTPLMPWQIEKGGTIDPNSVNRGRKEDLTDTRFVDPGDDEAPSSEHTKSVPGMEGQYDEYMTVPDSPNRRQIDELWKMLSDFTSSPANVHRGPEGFGGDSSLIMLDQFLNTPEGAAAAKSGDPNMIMEVFERVMQQQELNLPR